MRSVPRVPGGYSFPESFDVTQVVTVDQHRTGSLEYLASLRRVDDDFEVTLFDGASRFRSCPRPSGRAPGRYR